MAQQELGSRAERARLAKECAVFIAAQGHAVNDLINTENSSGVYLKNCSNAYQCFFSEGIQDCGYVFQGFNSRDCWQGIAIDSELSYRSLAVGSYNDLFSYVNVGGSSNLYSFGLMNSCSHCFGCVALKGKSYCVLNRQYSKEEYLELTPRIAAYMQATGEWGEYFPPALSPHSYRCSVACEFCAPLEPSELKRRGYRLDEVEEPDSHPEALSTSSLPEHVRDLKPEELLGKHFKCSLSGRAFNFQRRELDFYIKHNLPLPTRCWRERIRELIAKRPLIEAC
jgi:hypothetical protein